MAFVGPRGAFTEPRRPLTFSWLLADTTERPLCRPMRFPRAAPRGCCPLPIALRAEGPRDDLPVRTSRTRIRERLLSYRERASRNPHTGGACAFDCERSSAHRFAFSRLGSASGGASSFLLASTLGPPRNLATLRWTRRAMRLTDFCHLNESMRVSGTSCVPSSLRDLRRVDVTQSLGLCAT